MNRESINYWLNESPAAKYEQKRTERIATYRQLRARGFSAVEAFQYIKHWRV
jgi:hypothetical protein